MASRLLPWPLPALLAWGACWLLHAALLRAGWVQPVPVVLACGVGIGLSLLGRGWWRRVLIAAGFPLALAVSGAVVLPAWIWLLLLALLLLVYPLNAWRDAPLFPTPARALDALPTHAPLPAGARVLDAGCGLGHGLQALRVAYPQAQLHGVEWSWPLRALCGLRCPWAIVRRGDMWRTDWAPYAMVYLFQRPESMPRAATKALAQMQPGSWLVSLEFEATTLVAQAVHHLPDGRPVWLYCIPGFSSDAKRGRSS